MKLAWWPHTRSARVASARLRCLRVVAELRRAGMAASLYRPGREAPHVLVLSKRYDERSLAHAVGLRARAATRLVLDLCDNHFHAEAPDDAWQRRRAALLQAAGSVELIVCASEELARVVRSQPVALPPVTVIGDAVEPPDAAMAWTRLVHPRAEAALRRLQLRLAHRTPPPGGRLVWFGNHGSPNVEGGMSDLLRLRGTLERIAAVRPLSLTVISNDEAKYLREIASWVMPTHYLEWQRSTFSRALPLHDIAVIPVGRNPFTLCKTNNRVATALTHGLAVAADSIPAYVPFAECSVLDDWNDGLRRLVDDGEMRQRHVDTGRRLLAAGWDIRDIARLWAEALEPLAAASPASPVQTGRQNVSALADEGANRSAQH